VKLISLRGDDQIASVCRVPKGDEEDDLESDNPEESSEESNDNQTIEDSPSDS
jgi:hypothetical protein